MIRPLLLALLAAALFTSCEKDEVQLRDAFLGTYPAKVRVTYAKFSDSNVGQVTVTAGETPDELWMTLQTKDSQESFRAVLGADGRFTVPRSMVPEKEARMSVSGSGSLFENALEMTLDAEMLGYGDSQQIDVYGVK